MTTLAWCAVPAGEFVLGSNVRAANPPAADEAPRHAVALQPYRLGRTPVTVAEYGAFAAATGRSAPEGAGDTPVTYVTWHDACAFAEWVGGRLPTEAEWEAAASGGDGRLWPWGDEPPDASRAVLGRPIGGPEPLGGREAGASPTGVLDLAGNVAEWVSSAYRPYPYDPSDGREERTAPGTRVTRGGSYLDGPGAARCTARRPVHPAARDPYVGFRVAAAPGAGSPGVDWVDLLGGSLSIGRDPEQSSGDPDLRPDECPAHVVELAAFEIGRTPVTNAQYAAFTAATGYPVPPHGADGEPMPDAPVTFVDWHDASAFAAWAGARLPTEAEWERAARGGGGRRFPWGDVTEAQGRAHIGAGWSSEPRPVHERPEGASPCGALDLAGNVWEWVSSAYRPYPYDAHDGRESPHGADDRVLRGGSFASPDLRWARCAFRSHSRPTRRQAHIGFRLAR